MASRPARIPLAFRVPYEPLQLGMEELPVIDYKEALEKADSALAGIADVLNQEMGGVDK